MPRRWLLCCAVPLFVFGQQQQPQQPVQPIAPLFEAGDPDLRKPTGNCVIEGTVVNSANGKPVRGAAVSLAGMADVRKQATSDADGRFRFAELPPGYYDMYAHRDGFFASRNREGFLLAPGDHAKDMLIRLAPGAVVTGRVIDQDGEPMINVQVMLYRRQSVNGRAQWQVDRTAVTDDLGAYRIHSLQAGRFRVVAVPQSRVQEAPGGGQEIYDAATFGDGSPLALAAGQVATADFRLRKSAAFEITGRVEGLPPAERNVSIQLERRDQVLGIAQVHAQSNYDQRTGDFRVTGVAPGRYAITAISMGGRDRLIGGQTIEVKDQSVAGLAVKVGKGVVVSGKVTGLQPELAAAIRVALNSAGGTQWTATPAATTLNADGTFMIAAVPPGLWDVWLDPLPPGTYIKNVSAQPLDVTSSGASPTVEIALSNDGGTVTGQVQPVEKGRSVAVIIAPASLEAMVAGFPMQMLADREGRYRFAGIRPGEYRLYAIEQSQRRIQYEADDLRDYESNSVVAKVTAGSESTYILKPAKPAN